MGMPPAPLTEKIAYLGLSGFESWICIINPKR